MSPKEQIKEYLKELFFSKKDDAKNIPIKSYLLVIGTLIALVVILEPQIYIKNNIYYKSRSINKLYIEYQKLQETNIRLERRLEATYFKQDTSIEKSVGK